MTGMKRMPLARFEATVQHLVEGTLSRWLGGRLDVAEISAELTRAIEDNLRETQAPDRYQIGLNPDDHAPLTAERPTLAADLATLVVRLARRANLTLSSWPEVAVLPDARVGRHHVRIQAAYAAGLGEATQVLAAQEADAVPLMNAIRALDAFLIVEGKQHVPLAQPLLNLGRHTDNDIVLEAATVSRRHAQIRWRFGRFILYDLGSRGGTFVNDERIVECVLHPGDIIRLSDRALIYGEGLGDTPLRLPRRDAEAEHTIALRAPDPPEP